MPSLTSSLLRALLLVPLASCALGPGSPFATVTASLDARLDVPTDRDAGGGWIRLSSDYQIHIDALTFRANSIDLVAFGSAGGAFDPAHPPPGYTLCHSGHCHRSDGALVPYEQVAAENGGGGGAAPVASLDLPPGTQDALAGLNDLPLTCDGPCEVLAAADVRRVSLIVEALTITGRVRDGRASSRLPGEVPFRFEVDSSAEPLGFGAPVELPIDRASPPLVHLDVLLFPAPASFDPLDFAALPRDASGIDLATQPAARDGLLSRLAETSLTVQIRRSER
jgi:hypothetical protein